MSAAYGDAGCGVFSTIRPRTTLPTGMSSVVPLPDGQVQPDDRPGEAAADAGGGDSLERGGDLGRRWLARLEGDKDADALLTAVGHPLPGACPKPASLFN
jgi:hypothetical protein